MNKKTCWKATSGSCIDLIISNRKLSLINTGILETGLGDHHLLIYTMLRHTFDKLPPKIIKYRDWKLFNVDLFKLELSHMLPNAHDYKTFEDIFSSIPKNIANKTKRPEDMACYRKQRNLVVNMNRQAKSSFWKSVKPYFNSKCGISEERVLLVENSEVVTMEGDLSSIFNKFFNRITENLDIPHTRPRSNN